MFSGVGLSAIGAPEAGLPAAVRGAARVAAGLRVLRAWAGDQLIDLTAEDVRLRCFGMSKTFADSFAARLARPLGHDEFAIAAVLGTGEIGGVGSVSLSAMQVGALVDRRRMLSESRLCRVSQSLVNTSALDAYISWYPLL